MVSRGIHPAGRFLPALAAAVLLAWTGSACTDLPDTAAEPSGRPTPAHDLMVFVFDRSSSMKPHEVAHAHELVRERVAHLGWGDRIVALQMLEHTLDEKPVRWAQDAPEPEFPGRTLPSDSVSRARFVRDVADYLDTFAQDGDGGPIEGTDILSTMHLVASELRADPDAHATLYLFSDMLQVSAALNMERAAPPPGERWAQTQDSLGSLPDLRGLCVVVIGALDDTASGRSVRDFWKAYFRTAGAMLENANYSYRPVRLPSRPCGSPGRTPVTQ